MLEMKMVEPRALLQMDEVAAWLLVWELGSLETEGNVQDYQGLTEEQGREMEQLSVQYGGVFTEHAGLPSNRGMVHHIPLKEGVDLVNVRPYQYPHVMKEEIEQQVAEMLRMGVIRPSHNPYSSLVILVKKKDGSWRFCIDYRAMNQAIVPDKFQYW